MGSEVKVMRRPEKSGEPLNGFEANIVYLEDELNYVFKVMVTFDLHLNFG